MFCFCIILQKRDSIDYGDFKRRCVEFVHANLLRSSVIFHKNLKPNSVTMQKKNFVDALMAYSEYSSSLSL